MFRSTTTRYRVSRTANNGALAPPHDQRARRRPVVLRTVLLLLFACPAVVPPARAASTAVRFDTSYLVACRDVTTEEFAEANPNQRLIEARFCISAFADNDRSLESMQYIYRLVSPSGKLQIVDYGPKTTQATAVAGNVTIERKKASSKSLGISLSGSFESVLKGTAGSDLASNNASQIRYELKPPMEVVLVAGTIQRGTGVYFKLRSSPESPLDGSREFIVVMRVSRAWRGDVVYVRCEALEQRRGNQVSRGVSRFVVGLYSQGADDVRIAAENLVMAESVLRRAVAKHQRDIRRRSVPTFVHKVGAMLDMYDPKIPDSWLERLIYGPTNIEQYEFFKYLPEDVRRMASRYRRAKLRMVEFSGRRVAMNPTPLELTAR